MPLTESGGKEGLRLVTIPAARAVIKCIPQIFGIGANWPESDLEASSLRRIRRDGLQDDLVNGRAGFRGTLNFTQEN